MTNREVCAAYAQQRQEHGSNQNHSLFYDYDKIYSYGSHFCIAKIVGGKAYVTTRKYSNTTSHHVGMVMRELAGKGYELVESEYPEDAE